MENSDTCTGFERSRFESHFANDLGSLGRISDIIWVSAAWLHLDANVTQWQQMRMDKKAIVWTGLYPECSADQRRSRRGVPRASPCL